MYCFPLFIRHVQNVRCSLYLCFKSLSDVVKVRGGKIISTSSETTSEDLVASPPHPSSFPPTPLKSSATGREQDLIMNIM